MKNFIFVFFIIFSYSIFSQSNVFMSALNHEDSEIYPTENIGKYWIYFTDKNQSAFSLKNPQAFLSDKSIGRRNKMHIAITEQDLPVNTNYIEAVKQSGVSTIIQSRWLNAISVIIYSDEQLFEISQLSFVKEIQPVKKYVSKNMNEDVIQTQHLKMADNNLSVYGASQNQFTMINGDFLHNLNLLGQGMTIAVLDAGFYAVDTGAGFESFRNKNSILDTYNFPDGNSNVYGFSSHGMYVLGIMAADNPNSYVGAAPEAEYYLFRTEVVDSERVSEEDFWLAAAEQADFLGADIINSSLGYTEFDDSTENHTYVDMDGNTTICTKAADWAASKGILVCNSAGNSAQDTWHYIGAPADGDSVFSIGAVTSTGAYALFSSTGPTYDGRIKPNIAVQGDYFPVMNPDGSVGIGAGTSFASPLAAGTIACLWQAFPEKSNMEIMDAVQKSASQYLAPDSLLGYGIPNFALAYFLLKGYPEEDDGAYIKILTNPATENFSLLIYDEISEDAQLEIFDMSGKKIISFSPNYSDSNINAITLTGINKYANGNYLMVFRNHDQLITKQIAFY